MYCTVHWRQIISHDLNPVISKHADEYHDFKEYEIYFSTFPRRSLNEYQLMLINRLAGAAKVVNDFGIACMDPCTLLYSWLC